VRHAVIVSTVGTPIGRAYRGAFNATPAPTLAAHAIRAAVARAVIAPDEVVDVILGTACVCCGMGAAGLFEVL